MQETVQKMLDELMEVFKENSKELFNKLGLRFGTKYKNEISASKLFRITTYRLCLGICGEDQDVQIDLSVEGNCLRVSWASNNLLYTNTSKFNDEQITCVRIVARIFEHEEEWRQLLNSVDITPVHEELKRIEEQKIKEQEEIVAKNKALYDSLNIRVGTELIGEYNKSITVLRIAKNSVHTTAGVFVKAHIGKMVQDGVWKVK